MTARSMLLVALLLAGLVPATAQAPEGGTEPDAPAARHLADFEARRRSLQAFAREGPLVFRRAAFVTEVPSRFGEFTLRAEGPFSVGETMIIYIEPVGLVWKAVDDRWRFEVLVDLVIAGEDGRIIVEEKGFGRIAGHNREPLVEVMSFLQLRIADAPPGRYALSVTYHDAHSDKTAGFRLPFGIGAGIEIDRGFAAR